MFHASSRPSSGAKQLQYQPPVFLLERGGSSASGRGRAGWPARPRTTALLPPRTDGKPEAATAVDKLLIMGVRIHGLANPKYKALCDVGAGGGGR